MLNRLLVPPSLLLLAACSHADRTRPAEARIPITVARPRRVQDFQHVAVSGTLTSPAASSLVGFQVPGRALQVLPREGDPVRKGQLLAVLDSVNLGHALEAAQAQVGAARAAAQQAEQEFQRMQQLFDSQSLAPNDFAKFTAAREATRQQLQQALAGEGVARKNLADARLLAPVSGYIARRMVEPGVMVGAGQPVFEIANLDPIEVNVGVPETDIRLVRVGQPAAVTVPALPGRTFQGAVRVVNISADPATRTYQTRIALPNHDHALKVGMVAEASITGAARVDVTLVPLPSVVRDPQGATLVYVYFPDQGRVYSKRVDIGGLYGQEVQVRAGLRGDEAVVVAGQNALRNGMAADPAGAGR